MNIKDDEFKKYVEDDMWDDIILDSARRLADPLPFALEALEDLFRHESDIENGFARFTDKLTNFLWWADDAVQCLEAVASNPPPDLDDRLRRDAGVANHLGSALAGSPGRATEDDVNNGLAWLRGVTARLRAMLDQHIAERSAKGAAERNNKAGA